MKKGTVKKEIFVIAEEIFEVELKKIDLTLGPEEYDFDSILLIKFIRTVNEHFNIEVRLGEIFNAESLNEIFDVLENAAENAMQI